MRLGELPLEPNDVGRLHCKVTPRMQKLQLDEALVVKLRGVLSSTLDVAQGLNPPLSSYKCLRMMSGQAATVSPSR